MANLGQSARTSFGWQHGFVGHNTKILGRVDTRAVRFLNQRFVHGHITKLNQMLCLGLIINDFDLGKFSNDKGKHLVHEVVKHGDRVRGLRLGPLVTEQQSILQRLLALAFGIKRLRILDRLSTTWEHCAQSVCDVCKYAKISIPIQLKFTMFKA